MQKGSYEFPAAMALGIRTQFAVLADKGQILYNLNCAGCYTITVHSRKLISDFNPAQLTGYELRIGNKQHEASMPDTKVTAEELGLSVLFLATKRRVA